MSFTYNLCAAAAKGMRAHSLTPLNPLRSLHAAHSSSIFICVCTNGSGYLVKISVRTAVLITDMVLVSCSLAATEVRNVSMQSSSTSSRSDQLIVCRMVCGLSSSRSAQVQLRRLLRISCFIDFTPPNCKRSSPAIIFKGQQPGTRFTRQMPRHLAAGCNFFFSSLTYERQHTTHKPHRSIPSNNSQAQATLLEALISVTNKSSKTKRKWPVRSL